MRTIGSRKEDDEVVAILRGVSALGRRLRNQRPPGEATASGIGLLATLARLGPMPAVRLAEAEGLQAQSLSRLIAALETVGCIERQRSEVDRREIVIALTAHGRRVLGADIRARRAWLDGAMRRTLEPAERRTLIEAAAIMLKVARSPDGD